MARSTVTPITQINRRMAEAGRIRLGVKSGRAMKAIDHLRFTSPTRSLVDQVAELYGGEVQPWHDDKASPRDQWQVIITSERVRVILPPDCLDQWYEQWSGGGCLRRCDGVTCETPTTGPNGPDLAQVPCICHHEQRRLCEPYTRLRVVLPGVDMRGVWRLQTKGWNALHELPGMVDMVEGMTAQGRMVVAELGIRKEEKMVNGRKSHFIVPILEIPFTPEELVGGDASVRALAPAPSTSLDAPALMPGPSFDEVEIEAEIVSIHDAALRECAVQYGVDPDMLVAGVMHQAGGDDTKIARAVERMRAGVIEPDGFDANGRVLWIRHDQ